MAELDFHQVPDERSILAQWPVGALPKISIACIAYNHRPFIEQALKGFLIQETEYPFHIVCYDDCSTDGTRETLQAYQERYPNLIRLVLPEQNQRSLGRRPYVDFLHGEMVGDYIARCEGDDYWTDPKKLQKQVAFLEKKPDYVLSTHDVHTVDMDGQPLSSKHLPDFYKRDFSASELRYGWAGPVTQAVVFRNVLTEFPPEIRRTHLGDVFLASLLGQYGGSAYLEDVGPSMYRFHPNGIFSPLSDSDKVDMQGNSFFWIYKYYKRVGHQKEAQAFKLKLLEKHLRGLSLRECWQLMAVRFLGANLKRRIDRLIKSL